VLQTPKPSDGVHVEKHAIWSARCNREEEEEASVVVFVLSPHAWKEELETMVNSMAPSLSLFSLRMGEHVVFKTPWIQERDQTCPSHACQIIKQHFTYIWLAAAEESSFLTSCLTCSIFSIALTAWVFWWRGWEADPWKQTPINIYRDPDKMRDMPSWY